MDFTGKRLLILAGQQVHCKVVEAAKRMGVHTIVADYLEDSPAKLIADEKINFSIFDVEGIVQWCRNHPVDGVINFCNDPSQKPCYQICKELGLPFPFTEEQIDIFTNKDKFKACCRKYGVDTVREYALGDFEDDADISYPVYIKPVDSRGSKGQRICRNKEEVLSAYEYAKENSFSGKALIEQYMPNQRDLWVIYLFMNGQPHLYRTLDRYTGRKEDGLERVSTLNISPSKYSDFYVKEVHPKVLHMLQDLGIKNGPIFLQGFLDDGKVRFYDPALRFGGGNFERIYRAGTGTDVIRLLIEYALCGHFDTTDAVIDYRMGGKCGAIWFPLLNAGVIKSVNGFESWNNDPQIIAAAMHHNPGEAIEKNGNVSQRFGEYDILTSDRTAMLSVISSIHHGLSVQDTDGHEMMCELAADILKIGTI